MANKKIVKTFNKKGWVWLLSIIFTGVILSGCESKDTIEENIMDETNSVEKSKELTERLEKIDEAQKKLDELEEQFNE